MPRPRCAPIWRVGLTMIPMIVLALLTLSTYAMAQATPDVAAAPTTAPSAAAAPVDPSQVFIGAGADGTAYKVDTGDHAWMLVSTALVLMMTGPGLALFYGGLVRRKNVLATMMQSFAITCLVAVLWMTAESPSDKPALGTALLIACPLYIIGIGVWRTIGHGAVEAAVDEAHLTTA